ncbi:MAG TPA: hypothetical protein PLY87_14110 [Planctomycetaceae bacterium]|nr:hypothetical protein [Planctomycetaceae bacterium]HQZ66217.1 hypothetical protein [Planctomycetaceae bacterium]
MLPIDLAVASRVSAVPAFPAEADAAESDEPMTAAEDAPETSPLAAAESTTPADAATDADKAAFVEARKVQLQALAARFGQMVRSHLESAGGTEGASSLGQAAKSENGDVVVFQPSDDMVRLLLGAGGQEMLKSFNSELPAGFDRPTP